MATEDHSLLIQIMQYYEKLQSQASNFTFFNILIPIITDENIQNSFQMLCQTIDEYMIGLNEMQQQYKMMEMSLQKAEDENRRHIGTQQQMRLVVEGLQWKLEDIERNTNTKKNNLPNQKIVPQRKASPYLNRPKTSTFHTFSDNRVVQLQIHYYKSPGLKNDKRGNTQDTITREDLQKTIKVAKDNRSQNIYFILKASTQKKIPLSLNPSRKTSEKQLTQQLIRKKNASQNSFDGQ